MTDKDISDRVTVAREETLSDDHFILRKAHLRYRRGDGRWQSMTRQNFALGRAAAVLPLDRSKGRALLVRQFRWPVFASTSIFFSCRSC